MANGDPRHALLSPAARFALRFVACAGAGLTLTRICSLYYARIYLPDAFDTIHLELWPPLLVACATLQFLASARWLELRGRERSHAAND